MTVLLYGCESWVISGKIENKMNVFAASCCRIVLNIKQLDCVSNERILSYDKHPCTTHAQPLINSERQRQLRFFGHILRMPDEESCRRYTLYVPNHGRSRPGWQKTSCLSYLQKLIGDSENDLNEDVTASFAAYRCPWRKFI